MHFHLNYIDCVDDMENGFYTPWKGGFVMNEFREMSEYSRKYLTKDMHKTARCLKISLASRTIRLEYTENF